MTLHRPTYDLPPTQHRPTTDPTQHIPVIIVALDQQYQMVAHWLTERENYRTDLQFQDSLIAKLVVFQVIFRCYYREYHPWLL